MATILDIIREDWAAFMAFTPRLLVAVMVLIVSYFIGKYLSRLVSMVLRRFYLQEMHQSFFRIVIIVVACFIGLVVALNILGLEKLAISVLAGGGVTAIVLGFAFREIGENFLAGIFLAFSRPFKTGDAINTEDIEGKVMDIQLRYTHLRTDDGRDIYVPNSQLFNKPVTNFTRDGLRRIGFVVGIDYANDAKAACAMLEQAVAAVDGVLQDPEPGAFILNLAPQYVELQVFFWVDVFDRSSRQEAVQTDVLDRCRSALLEEGYVVSSETTSKVALVENTTTA